MAKEVSAQQTADAAEAIVAATNEEFGDAAVAEVVNHTGGRRKNA